MSYADLLSDTVSVLSNPRLPEPKRRVLAAAMLIMDANEGEASRALADAVCRELERSGSRSSRLRALRDRPAHTRRPRWYEGVELRVFLQDVIGAIGAARRDEDRATPLTLINGGAQ